MPLSKALGADATTLPLTVIYLRTLLCFSPLFLFNNILIAFIRNDNNPKLAMAGMVICSFSNIVFDYIFMFPLGMGMFGAALASVIAFTLSVGVLCLHFWKKQNQFFLCRCKIIIAKVKTIILLGASSFIGELSIAVSMIAFNLIILGIKGNIGVAAYGIIVNTSFFAFSIFNGVAQGIQPLISKGYGSGNNFLVKQVLKYAIIVVCFLSLAIYCSAYMFSANIVSVFNSEANITLALLATRGIKIYFIGLIFAGLNIISATFFSAITSAKTGAAISILRSSVILIPMVIFLGVMLSMDGIWLSFVLTEFIVCLVSIILLFNKTKKYS